MQSLHCAANCLQHVRSNGQGTIVSKSHATHRVLSRATCVQIARYTSSVIKCNMCANRTLHIECYHVQHVCKSHATHRALITCNMCANRMLHIECYHEQHVCKSHVTHRVLITRNTLSAYHMQHRCLSRAPHRVLITCNTSCATWRDGRDSSANKFDRVEIAFILALFFWRKPLADEGGDETQIPGENP